MALVFDDEVDVDDNDARMSREHPVDRSAASLANLVEDLKGLIGDASVPDGLNADAH